MPFITRREFNALVLAGAGTLSLPACGSATQGAATLTGGTATLTFARFPSLMSAGGSAVVDVPGRFPIVVVRTSANDAVALSATCTHLYCTMAYASQGQTIHCPCHGADFALDGSIIRGPVSIPIPIYPATVGTDAITVQID